MSGGMGAFGRLSLRRRRLLGSVALAPVAPPVVVPPPAEFTPLTLSNTEFANNQAKGFVIGDLGNIPADAVLSIVPRDRRVEIIGTRLTTWMVRITDEADIPITVRATFPDGRAAQDTGFTLKPRAYAQGVPFSAVQRPRVTGLTHTAAGIVFNRSARGHIATGVRRVRMQRRVKGASGWTQATDANGDTYVAMRDLTPGTTYEVLIEPFWMPATNSPASARIYGETTIVEFATPGSSPTPAPYTVEGVQVTPFAFATMVSIDGYASKGAPDPDPGVRALMDRCTEILMVEPFDTLDLHDVPTGKGRWHMGSRTVINREPQLYLSKAGAEAVEAEIGNKSQWPLEIANGVLALHMRDLTPATRKHIGEITSRPAEWTDDDIFFCAGRLDSTRWTAFFGEGDLIYFRSIWRMPGGSNAQGYFPCPFWFIAASGAGYGAPDGSYIEPDVSGEGFGAAEGGTAMDFTMRVSDLTGAMSPIPISLRALDGMVYAPKGMPFLDAGQYHEVEYLIRYSTGEQMVLFDRRYVGRVSVTDQRPPHWHRPMQSISNMAEGSGASFGSAKGLTPYRCDIAHLEIRAEPDPARPAVVSGRQPETDAWLARAGTASAARQNIVNDLYLRLKNGGFGMDRWRLKCLWLPVGGDGNDAQRWINLMSPGTYDLATVANGGAYTLRAAGITGDGKAWLRPGLLWPEVNPQHGVFGAWVDQVGPSDTNGADRIFGDSAGAIRCDVRKPWGMTLAWGTGAGTITLTPSATRGYFCQGRHRIEGQPTIETYTVADDDYYRGGQIHPRSLTAMPNEPVRVLPGKASIAAAWLGDQWWHPMRQQQFRDNVLRPTLAAMGVTT